MKRILIDLYTLKNPYNGLGQVALNYGRYYRDNYQGSTSEQIYLFVPRQFVGRFGDKVRYIVVHRWYIFAPWLLGKRFDVWHTLYHNSPYRPFAKKVVYTIHDFTFVYELMGFQRQRYLFKIQHRIDDADIIGCISRFTYSETRRYMQLDTSKIRVICEGLERIDTLPQTPLTDITSPFLFTIGEVRSRKNIHVLIDIMRLLPQYQLYVAGKSDTHYGMLICSELLQKGVTNVHFLGCISEEQKCWLYSHCTAFVFPSLFEGWGFPILEAMLFHKPVICSHIAALIESGSNYVSFFPDDYDASTSVRIIQETIRNTSSVALDNAFQYATSFSWTRHIEEYLHIYRSL